MRINKFVATGKSQAYSCLEPSGAGLHQAPDRTANRPGSQRPRGQEGARRSNTQAHSDPLRTGTVRGPEHRTSNIERPTSNLERRGKATQSHPKATLKPYTRHRLRSTKPPQSHPKATPRLDRK